MGDWELSIENIAGFAGSKIIPLKSGLNWIFGENATGKSSIVMSLKFLNDFKQYFKDINKAEDPRAFLHHGCSSGKVTLKNSGHDYFTEYKDIFTSGGSGKLIEGKITKQLMSSNPNVMDFA